ncbi:MAG TPA: efflux RND transporter periplasmic adaptor subunit [Puia sp.]|nr:efflux RND transporter periplasmic adaptor subunit [Puia sp.]
MNKNIGMYLFALSILFAACNTRQKETKPAAKAEDIYTCSMHPQVLEHHPGNCPICGMELIKKNTESSAIANIQLESLLKPTNQYVISSIPVTTVEVKNVNVPIKAYGTIEYDTRYAATISARASGRIEKMYIRYRFQPVEAGQKIMDIYSPEILTAEQNVLFLLQNDAGNASFIQAAKEKLLLLGMSEGQLKQVIQTGKPLYSISIYSNYSGHVHDAGMMHDAIPTSNTNTSPVTQELTLKEGMYVQKGQSLLMLMDHHMVWAALQIFPTDQSLVKVGNPVSIVPETDTSAVINSSIDFFEPFFRDNSKTVTARVYFHNESMLPIGSHLTANILTNGHHALWLPQTAVLSLGMNEVALMKSGDGFIAHKITTGSRSGNDIQVLSGLSEKDTVAVNAQYLIDSESFITTSSNK